MHQRCPFSRNASFFKLKRLSGKRASIRFPIHRFSLKGTTKMNEVQSNTPVAGQACCGSMTYCCVCCCQPGSCQMVCCQPGCCQPQADKATAATTGKCC
jgi:hypothetical protein